jgi:hypothetical protein
MLQNVAERSVAHSLPGLQGGLLGPVPEPTPPVCVNDVQAATATVAAIARPARIFMSFSWSRAPPTPAVVDRP